MKLFIIRMKTLIGTLILLTLSIVVLYWGIKCRKYIYCGKNCDCNKK